MYIVHLGFSGFPTGNATIQRIRFTFKAVELSGYTPLIINKLSSHPSVPYRKNVNRFDGLLFVYTSHSLTRPESFVKRNINRLGGRFAEIRLLYRRRRKIGAAILYTQYFADLVYYRAISRLFGFKLVIQYVEFRSKIPSRTSFFTRLNDRLFDTSCSRFCDGAIVISEFLKNQMAQKNARLPVVKVPAICDFRDFAVIPAATPGYPYFLYCGTISYLPVISFIIEFFEKAKDEQLYGGKLVCVLGSESSQNFGEVEEMIGSSKYTSDIILYRNLPYREIIPLYKSADLLLIPLRNTIQDIARFPHKVSEYTASGRPLISSKIGELDYYFRDKETALLADEYQVDQYIETLREMNRKNISFDEIGRKGYEVGYRHFHFESNAPALKQFFEKL